MNSIISTNKTKLFLKKDSMTGTTKFNFMTHLPTPQPNRSRFAMVFLLFMTFLLGSAQGWGQTNPTAFSLVTGDYSFTTQTATSTTYPTNIQGWSTSTNNLTSAETAIPGVDLTLVASGTLTTSGISNLGAGGFQFISSGSNPNKKVGEICLALNTTNRSNIKLGWTAADLQSGNNYYSMGLVLQYRVGTTSTFTTIPLTTYTSSGTNQAAAQVFSNIALPVGCENQSVVQLRWLYYQIGTAGSGGRDPISLDEISVISDPTISSINVTSGCVGSSLVITGTNLIGATSVTIGGTAVTSFVVNSNTQITAVVANGNTGAVSVTTPNGTASGFSFTSNPLPVTTFTGITASQNLCQGLSYTLTPTTAGGTWGTSASSFLSVSGGVANILSGATVNGNPANITYSITDGNNCTNTSTVSVFLRPTPVAPALTASQSFCAGATVANISTTGALAGSTLTWYAQNTGATTYASSIALSNNSTYYASQTLNSCESSSRTGVVATVNALPTVTATASQSICTGSNVTLSGSGASTYVWNNGISNGVAFVPASTTTYTVTGTDANGCVNTATSTVTVNALPTVATSPINGSSCGTGTVILSATAPSGTTLDWYAASTGGTVLTGGAGVTSFTTPSISSTTIYYAQVRNTTTGCLSASRTAVTATVNALPSAATSPIDGSRCGTGTVVLSATAPSGTTIDWYAASTGGSVLASGTGVTSFTTPSISTTTIYYAQVRNTTSSCLSTSRTAVTATVNVIPTVTATASQTICSGTSVTLSGIGASTYVWNNGISNGVSFIPTATTTYTVTGTAANGCTNTASSTVTVNPVPTVTNASICAGGTGSMSVTSTCNDITGQISGPNDATVGTNVTGVGTLAWTNPGNIAGAGTAGMSVSASTTTNYLQGIGFGFAIPSNSIINGITVTINRSTSGSTSPLLRDNQVSLVKGGSIQATNKAVTGTNWSGTLADATYGGATDLWGTTWTAADINASNFGIVLSAINSNTGSARTAAVDYMRITVTYTIPGTLNWYTVSSGGSVIATGSTLNPVGVSNSGLTNTNTAGITPYYVSCSTATGACRTQANFEIKALPTATISAGSATTFCQGGNVVLTASAGTSYLWSNGATTSSITVSTSGSYTVTVTNANGCSATSSATVVTVNALPTATITAGSATTFCQGGNVVLTASAGTSYLWSNGATTSSITVSVSGSFTVTVTNANGCSATSSATAVTVTTPTLTYYIDADHDGFGAGTASNYCTSQGAGYSTVNTDCNDANVSISPMAEELCDGIDNDCNASTADGLGTTTYFRDADNDGFGNLNITSVSCQSPSGYVANATDCDDNNAAYHTINTYFEDADGDTFGNGDVAQNACFLTTGYSVNHEDCDDTNAEVNPNATEVCNLIDDDCDGVINDGLTSIDYHLDADHDGYGSATVAPMCAALPGYVTNSADCDDNNPNVNPSALEICGNTVDEDCIGGDLVPSYYTSRQSGPWTTPSTWNKSCDNTTYNLAAYAPQENYAGIVTIAASHAVTVGTTDAYVASAGNLNINATGSVIVNGKMSVSQSLVNNGTLTVNNGASFLQSSTTGANTGSGNYVVNMTLSGTNNGSAPNGRYWYIGSPMNNTNIYNTFYNTTTMTRIWDYLPATNAWNAIINSSTGVGVNSATNMAVGIGYLYRAGSAQSVTFNGTSSTFNNNITTPLEFTGVGYKYVANPYTSHVDWKQVTRTGLNVSYWIRNAANTSYESYNATSGLSTNNISGLTNQYIPPMQGFWIYAYTTPCSLRMDNGDRVHAGNALHAPMHNQVVRLNLNDGKTDDQALVYENENASNGIEEFDTDKFMDENHHQVYFLEGTKEVSMDGLKDATAKQRVDMGIQITAAGTYTINAVELGVEEDVVLEDKFTHTFQDLKRNSSYSFTANAGTFNNRFVLHFTLNPQTETAMETVEVTETVGETEGVSVYTTTGQQVKVWVTNTTDFQNATVKVYDSVGNMIERKNMTSSELLLDLNTATGVYLVEVTGTEKVFTKKIFITK